jgi:hypothetical protein
LEDRNSKLETRNSETNDHGPVSNFEFPVSSGLPEDRSNLKYFIVGIAAVIVLVAIAIVVIRHRSSSASVQVDLTPEQKNYLANITFADAKMSAATNFLGQRVIYLDAEISNRGIRAVKQVEISMEFTDVLGQVVLRERAGVFPPALLPLQPGETRAFQLFFDRIPSDWNQTPPRITPVAVQF